MRKNCKAAKVSTPIPNCDSILFCSVLYSDPNGFGFKRTAETSSAFVVFVQDIPKRARQTRKFDEKAKGGERICNGKNEKTMKPYVAAVS